MLLRQILLYSLLLNFLSLVAFGQTEIDGNPVWKSRAEKVGSQQYRLVFTTTLNKGWALYTPQQLLFDQPAAQIQFGDSAIQLVEPLKQEGKSQRVNSELLSQEVEWQEGAITWSAVIDIRGVVPASIQGTLLYTYGRDQEIYPATPSVFVVSLEGGLAQEDIRRSSMQLARTIECWSDGSPPWLVYPLQTLQKQMV